jgi:ankyrin repeat protein
VLLLHKEDIDDLQACDSNGMSIAHYAAWSSQSSYRHVLASIRPDDMRPFVARDHLGRSIIHFAAQRGNIEILRSLIDINSDIDINCKDRDGQTVLHYAVESKRVDAIKLLVSKGADVNAVDLRGRTPMHRAAAKNNLLAIDCIVEVAGKNSIDNVDYQSRTPEQLARQFGAIAAAEHLRDIGGNGLVLDTIVQHVSRTNGLLEARPVSKFKTGLSFSLFYIASATSLGILMLFLIYQITLWGTSDYFAAGWIP